MCRFLVSRNTQKTLHMNKRLDFRLTLVNIKLLKFPNSKPLNLSVINGTKL